MTAHTWKIAGALLILGSGAVCGIFSARRERARLTLLDAWIDLIERIRTEIDLYLRPLDTILSHIEPTLLLRAGAGKQRSTLSGLLLAASPELSGEAQRLLQRLISELGTTYRPEQLRLCDEQLIALRRERERIFSALPARVRLCGTLAPCIAACLAILLW